MAGEVQDQKDTIHTLSKQLRRRSIAPTIGVADVEGES